MALRVLLADESSTIKRVIQLALQDYAVEVKSVPVGLDVMSVAKSFKPDVVFADILLPKRSGYEVSQDLKSDPQTQKIPVILMWSGFMDLDEQKATQSQADGRLEKPFETEQLRSLVQSLVPQLSTNPLSSYLKFPKLPEFDEPKQREAPKLEVEKFDIDAIPDASSDEVFQQVPLHKSGPLDQADDLQNFKIDLPSDDDNAWAKQDLGQFKLELPEDPEKVPAKEDTRKLNLNLNPGGSFEEIVFETPRPVSNSNGPSALDIALTEKVIREEAQKMLEAIIWKILPDIAERVVKEEINKLIQETEKSI